MFYPLLTENQFISLTQISQISRRALAIARACHPAEISSKLHSSGKLKVMVLKHTPLGEINLPFVASNAIIPRCRRNRRQTESHQACLNGRGAKEGNSKLTDAIIPRRPCAGSLGASLCRDDTNAEILVLVDNCYIISIKKEGRHPDDQSSNFKNLIP